MSALDICACPACNGEGGHINSVTKRNTEGIVRFVGFTEAKVCSFCEGTGEVMTEQQASLHRDMQRP